MILYRPVAVKSISIPPVHAHWFQLLPAIALFFKKILGYQTTNTTHNWGKKKNKAIPQMKYKTLAHSEDTVEMANIRNEIHQLNQQIAVMGCNKWQFQ